MKLKLLVLSIFIQISVQAQIIEVSAGQHNYYQTPIFVKLSQSYALNTSFQIKNKQTGKTAPAQLADSTTIAFILPDSLTAGNTHQYELYEVKVRRPTAPTVSIKQDKESVKVSIKNNPLFTYHTSLVKPPADSPAYYGRSGFIHPVYSPNGKIVTDDFPTGHIHQHALFSAWTNTTFKKEFLDFWNQHLQKGIVEHVSVEKIIQGHVFGQLQVLLRYRSTTHGEVLKEKWTLTIYSLANYYLFDLYSDQVNTSTDTLFINTYHYGGLAFRGSREWNPDDKVHYKGNWHIITSEGIKDTSANGTHARWVDASGVIGGATAGVTVFNHPNNFRYPQAIRVHPAFPYWCYTPTPDGPFFIAPGTHYQSRYRYFVHNDSPDIAQVTQLESEWITPPSVKVIDGK